MADLGSTADGRRMGGVGRAFVKVPKSVLVSAISVGLLAGSAVGAMAQDVVEPSSASAGCDGPLVEPGVYDGVNELQDVVQAYRVMVPKGYADAAPVPVILFPAAALGASLDNAFSWWQPYLDPAESMFVVVEQTLESGHSLTTTLTALLDRLEAEYCVDLRRVHAFGHSSSGPTVTRLACEASERIASFHVSASGFSHLGCAPERAVPLMAMSPGLEAPYRLQEVENWAETYECDGDPVIEDLGAGVTRTAFQGCLADFVFYVIEDAGHGFIHHECVGEWLDTYCYTNEVFDQLREMERFFAEHPLPAE
jgi:hypothetical protein